VSVPLGIAAAEGNCHGDIALQLTGAIGHLVEVTMGAISKVHLSPQDTSTFCGLSIKKFSVSSGSTIYDVEDNSWSSVFRPTLFDASVTIFPFLPILIEALDIEV